MRSASRGETPVCFTRAGSRGEARGSQAKADKVETIFGAVKADQRRKGVIEATAHGEGGAR